MATLRPFRAYRPEKHLVAEIAAKFGSQCVVASVDARRTPRGNWEIFTHGGRKPTGIDAVEWAARGEKIILVRIETSPEDIETRLRHILLTTLSDMLGETAKENDITNLVSLQSELSAGVRDKASDQFKALGL